MGVASKAPFPHHGGKIERNNWAKNQYVHWIDQYYPLWIDAFGQPTRKFYETNGKFVERISK
eukprot:8006090-Karenia_brevis.AAC.1